MFLKFLFFFVLPGTILHGACSYGSIACVEVLLANGAEVNAFSAIGSETPLIQTSKCGHVDIVRRLLVAGAHVNHQSEDGSHALISACEFGHLDVVHLLLGK